MMYEGNIKPGFLAEALEAFRQYKSDKEPLVQRLRDNERFYRESYSRLTDDIRSVMKCDTPFIFSAIENAAAEAIENYPTANILERDPDGTDVAEAMSKVIPVQLDMSEFKKIYSKNARNKFKYGTAVYGVTHNNDTNDINIDCIDILDVFVDMHIEDIQDSPFLFICAAVDNNVLKAKYPDHAHSFSGESIIETLTQDYRIRNRSLIVDCYYKKADGALHMMKLYNEEILTATEDMPGYENGLYEHGKYPVVFDVLYPVEHCPFGFSMLDIGKGTQLSIDKLDGAITKNIMINASPRYFCKRNGGINEDEFMDISKEIVHYDGAEASVFPIQSKEINGNYLEHRETKKDELKELLGNRDFQQGDTVGGVISGTAIDLLQKAGQKRSRAHTADTYEAFKEIVQQSIELMRQFYTEPRVFRVDDSGKRDFVTFARDMLFNEKHKPIEFDIDVVPQRQNMYSREAQNQTLLTFWTSGLFSPDNYELASIVLKNMDFDGKDELLNNLKDLKEEQEKAATPPGAEQALPQGMSSLPTNGQDPLVPVDISGGGMNGNQL